VSAPTDVEISRALNAVSTTLRDQRPERFDAARVEQIAVGALAGERKLEALAESETSGELRIAGEQRIVATVRLQDGQWTVERKLRAGGSSWALPQPAHDQQQASGRDGG
jgi:nitrogen fixation protein FixH